MKTFKIYTPLYCSTVAAGFPSPADDYIEKKLDLNEHLIRKPSATFFVRVSGDSMNGVGIFPGDLLIVDRSLKARHRSVILACLDGDFTVKRLMIRDGEPELHPENPKCKPTKISSDHQFEIWGVVTYVIHEPK